MARRWIRLDCEWDTSDWLVALEPAAQLAWIRLLAWTKAHGKAGRTKAMTPRAAGVVWRIPADAVQAMLEAAHGDDAMSTDNGEWVVTGWAKYQEPDPSARDRKRRERERRADGMSRGVTDVTRDGRRDPSRDHRPPTDDSENTPPSSPRPRADVEGVATLKLYLGPGAEAVDRFAAAAQHGTSWAVGLMGLYGPSGTDDTIWRGIPPPEQPAVLAKAMDRYAAEGKPYSGRFFRRILETARDERRNGGNGGEPHGGAAAGPAGADPEGAGGGGSAQASRRRRGFGT